MTNTPKNIEEPAEDILAPVRAAIALGLTIPAIPGTQVYATYLPEPYGGEYRLDTPRPRPYGLHATINGALDAMYAAITTFWEFEYYRLRDTPWMTEELYRNALKYEPTSLTFTDDSEETLNAIATIFTLREEWLNTHTKIETICTYLKIGYENPNNLTENINKNNIQFLHPWIVTHVIYN